MQVTLNAALSLDSSLAGWSDQEIRDKLLSDPAYNIKLGVNELSNCYNKFGGYIGLSAACYNGGAGANQIATKDSYCRENRILTWQCPNYAGYQPTRNYVPRVISTYNSLKK